MATVKEIKEAILKTAGNPETGVVAANAQRWAEAIAALDKVVEVTPDKDEPIKTPTVNPTRETRVTKPSELR